MVKTKKLSRKGNLKPFKTHICCFKNLRVYEYNLSINMLQSFIHVNLKVMQKGICFNAFILILCLAFVPQRTIKI